MNSTCRIAVVAPAYREPSSTLRRQFGVLDGQTGLAPHDAAFKPNQKLLRKEIDQLPLEIAQAVLRFADEFSRVEWLTGD